MNVGSKILLKYSYTIGEKESSCYGFEECEKNSEEDSQAFALIISLVIILSLVITVYFHHERLKEFIVVYKASISELFQNIYILK